MVEQYCHGKSVILYLWLGLVVSLLALPATAFAEIVRLPMTFDFSLLRSLVIKEAYLEPHEQAKVVSSNAGCNEIYLSNPQLQAQDGRLKFLTDIRVVWGAPIGGSCYAPLHWSGKILFWQQPKIDDKWRLHFQIDDSALFDKAGKEAALPGLIWSLVKEHVHDYVENISINLAPPVEDLKRFLVPDEGGDPFSAAELFLASMRPELPQVTDEGLVITILAKAIPAVKEDDPFDMSEMNVAELDEQVLALWRTWDALLVSMLSQLADKPLSIEERQLLLDVLLTARYEFSEVLGTPEFTTDFIRNQFITAWISLKPLFENHLAPLPGDSLLGYLSFFTAADALVTLDRLGPLLNIEVSREGFYRMAHMLNSAILDEGEAINQQLRDLLGLGPILELPALKRDEEPKQDGNEELQREDDESNPPVEQNTNELDELGLFDWSFLHRLFGLSEAWASESPDIDTVMSWTAEMTPAKTLLPRVQKILMQAASSQKEKLDKSLTAQKWDQTLIEATAWQESCFRQFTVKDTKITYLLSYNNSSVGVMQVNEKVWRGIYDLQKLRWDIDYNSAAGMEILTLYLNRYLAKNTPLTEFNDPEKRRYLATWLYSLYNGGPGQVKKFPQRHKAGKLYKSELLFQQKYDLVEEENWFEKVTCLPAS